MGLGTYLAHSVDEGILVEDVHRGGFEEGARPLDSDVGPLHFAASSLDHINAVPDIAAKGNERTMGRGMYSIHAGVEEMCSASCKLAGVAQWL
jgi:hypothetical protein